MCVRVSYATRVQPISRVQHGASHIVPCVRVSYARVAERFSRSVMNETGGGGSGASVGGDGEDGEGGGGGRGGGGMPMRMRKPSSHADLGACVAHANEQVQSLPYFAVESYLQYQGKKFIQRFDANCYIQLTYTLDSHDVVRSRMAQGGGVERRGVVGPGVRRSEGQGSNRLWSQGFGYRVRGLRV